MNNPVLDLAPLLLSLSFLLVFSNKSFLLIFLLFFLYVFLYLKKSIVESFFFTAILALPFERGIRDWIITIVPPGPFSWLEGYFYYFTFSVKTILLVAAVIATPQKAWRNFGQTVHVRLAGYALCFFLLCTIVSSLLSFNPLLSFFVVARILVSLAFFFVGMGVLRSQRNRKFLMEMIMYLFLMLGIVGCLQLFLARPLGLFLEETAITSPEGYTTSDGVLQYRAIGLLGHPTFFGSFMSILFPIVVVGFITALETHSRKTVLYVTSIFLGTTALIGSMSRSSWAALLLIVIGFCWLNYAIFLRAAQKIMATKNMWVIVVVALMGVIGIGWHEFSLRFDSIVSIGQSINTIGRENLLQRSLEIVQNHFWFGVGPNHFTWAMNQFPLTLAEQTFLKPVHNVPLLIASESGILALTAWLVFFAVAIGWGIKTRQSLVANALMLAIGAYLFNSQFHAVYLHDPSMDVAFLCVALLLNEKTTNPRYQ